MQFTHDNYTRPYTPPTSRSNLNCTRKHRQNGIPWSENLDTDTATRILIEITLKRYLEYCVSEKELIMQNKFIEMQPHALTHADRQTDRQTISTV